ncbi:SAM-dependent methyltransferase [Methanonatronarchaeum thermophilum]|uniref:SAM-dependent methyltransferase n=1 Tax=Methanonatronarchaeum thermophilum TaxID=1927129 RepID=A0A1Y3GIU3_9EURY|nr:FkbM family methyltransferase [Methanonatronarchaeum thermophilum]OUJ19316.1 SAM-dependent methyltransferase [Methanonatronarchaeum thermophilum]
MIILSIFYQGIKKFKKDGFIGLIKGIIRFLYVNYIRKLLPSTGNWKTIRGIRIGSQKYREKPLDEFLLEESPSPTQKHKKENEELIKKFVKKGDNVVIVGGGDGITTVTAAKKVGEQGLVTVYEGSKNQINILNKTIELNEIKKQVKIEHKLVGNPKKLKGSSGSAKKISPHQLPDCDILEMDCEGSEIEIIKKMKIRPSIIIVETHPKFGSPTPTIKYYLSKIGYDCIDLKPDRVSGDVVVFKLNKQINKF